MGWAGSKWWVIMHEPGSLPSSTCFLHYPGSLIPQTWMSHTEYSWLCAHWANESNQRSGSMFSHHIWCSREAVPRETVYKPSPCRPPLRTHHPYPYPVPHIQKDTTNQSPTLVWCDGETRQDLTREIAAAYLFIWLLLSGVGSLESWWNLFHPLFPWTRRSGHLVFHHFYFSQPPFNPKIGRDGIAKSRMLGTERYFHTTPDQFKFRSSSSSSSPSP